MDAPGNGLQVDADQLLDGIHQDRVGKRVAQPLGDVVAKGVVERLGFVLLAAPRVAVGRAAASCVGLPSWPGLMCRPGPSVLALHLASLRINCAPLRSCSLKVRTNLRRAYTLLFGNGPETCTSLPLIRHAPDAPLSPLLEK